MPPLTANPFRSARLQYRAIESPADDEFFHQIQADPFSHDTSTPSILAPMTRAISKKIQEGYEASMLGVMICLPTTDENLAAAGNAWKKDDLVKPSLVGNDPIDSGIPIGCMTIDRQKNSPRMHHTLAGGIAIDIAPRHQNKGYGREALNWILDWGFTHANFHRIEIRVLGWNDRAIHLYKSIGFRLESTEKEAWWHNGKYHDDHGLAILSHEWRELRAKQASEQKNVIAGEVVG